MELISNSQRQYALMLDFILALEALCLLSDTRAFVFLITNLEFDTLSYTNTSWIISIESFAVRGFNGSHP